MAIKIISARWYNTIKKCFRWSTIKLISYIYFLTSFRFTFVNTLSTTITTLFIKMRDTVHMWSYVLKMKWIFCFYYNVHLHYFYHYSSGCYCKKPTSYNTLFRKKILGATKVIYLRFVSDQYHRLLVCRLMTSSSSSLNLCLSPYPHIHSTFTLNQVEILLSLYPKINILKVIIT